MAEELLESKYKNAVALSDATGPVTVFPEKRKYHDIVAALKLDGYNFASDLCAVDYLDYMERVLPTNLSPQRFEIVLNLLSHGLARRVKVRVQVESDSPHLPSVVDLYPGVENMEREAFDMFGIVFDSHPDMTRILMPEGWEGHPLRKDYSVGRVPVQFKEAPQPR